MVSPVLAGFALTVVLLLTGACGVAYVIYVDAKQRGVPGSYPVYWAVGSFHIPFIIVPLYAYYAPRLGTRSEPWSSRERRVVWLSATVWTAVFVGFILTPPDPETQLITQVGLLVPLGLVFYLLVFRGYHESIYGHIPGS